MRKLPTDSCSEAKQLGTEQLCEVVHTIIIIWRLAEIKGPTSWGPSVVH